MVPVTVYLDKETEEKIRAAAKAKNISVSQWVANLIRENLQPRWPDDVAALAEAWPDFPRLEEIRGKTTLIRRGNRSENCTKHQPVD